MLRLQPAFEGNIDVVAGASLVEIESDVGVIGIVAEAGSFSGQAFAIKDLSSLNFVVAQGRLDSGQHLD
jgi:hypothetical protein